MRILPILLALALTVAACAEVDDDADDVAEVDPTPTPEEPAPVEPEPTPIEDDEVDDEPTPTPAPETDDVDLAELEERVDQVAEQVVELRGLELIDDLDFNWVTRDELRERLEEDIEVEQEDIDTDWIFRLIPDRDADVEQMFVDLQAEGTGGFYDPETAETYVVSEDQELSAYEEVILAHEIVHALQDQHFDLQRREEFEPDYDRMLAFTAVVEGDATLFEDFYVEEYFDEERQQEYQQEAMTLVQDSDLIEVIQQIPRYYIESLVFPYIVGPEFVSHTLDNGFSGIDEHLENPPASTHQIMNPQEYLAGELDDPREVELPDFEERLDDTWDEISEGTLGPFTLTIMLEENGITGAAPSFDGWEGTGFASFTGENGDVLGVLATVWEDDESAAGFADVLESTMDGYDDQGDFWAAPERYHAIIVDGDKVSLKSATDEDALMDVAQLN